MPAEPTDDDDELARDRSVIAAATPGPWRTAGADDDFHMNARVISRDGGTGELADHENNVAVVLLQTPRYADVGDGRWNENAEFIVRARERWPLLVARVARLNDRLVAVERENATLRSDHAGRERALGTRPGAGKWTATSFDSIERRPVGMSAWYSTLAVRNVEQTAAYYLKLLGFYSWGYGFRGERRVQCTVFRDQAMIALSELQPGIAPRPLRGIVTPPDDDAVPNWMPDVEIQVVDLAAYFDEVSARGARIVKPLIEEEEPTFVVEDGNGYRVRFAQCEPRVTADPRT